MTYDDILYDRHGSGTVTITINRPDKLNAFTAKAVDELIHAFQDAWRDKGCGVVILTGAGDRAFCVGKHDVGIDIEESAEGTIAFQEKRPPDFGRFRK